MSNGVIMRDRRSYYRKVFHYAYSIYIQANNEAIKDKKTNHNYLKVSQSQEEKLYKKCKIS